MHEDNQRRKGFYLTVLRTGMGELTREYSCQELNRLVSYVCLIYHMYALRITNASDPYEVTKAVANTAQ